MHISFASSSARKLLSFVLFLLACFSLNAFADTNTEPHPPTGKVIIGAYVNGIRSIDFKAGTVELDLFVWFRTKGEKNILDSFETMNGSIGEKSSIVKKKIGDENYYSMRIIVKAFENYELFKFPLDNQNLKLFIEDADEGSESLTFMPDDPNTKVGESVTLPGWKIGNVKITVNPNMYETNYGDPSLGVDNSSFSRATLNIPIGRIGIGYFFKLFSTVFLSAFVTFLCFHIKPEHNEARFAVGVGGLFAVVASSFVLSSLLPESHLITMGEALLMITMGAIFVVLLESVLSLELWEHDKRALALKLDRFAGWLMPITYLIVCAATIYFYLL